MLRTGRRAGDADSVLSYVALVQWSGWSPQLSNLGAFLVAFGISFLGHFHWTFSNPERADWRGPMLRFFVVALFGLGLNAATVHVITTVAGLSYLHAIIMMLVGTPACIFVLSQQWAFASRAD